MKAPAMKIEIKLHSDRAHTVLFFIFNAIWSHIITDLLGLLVQDDTIVLGLEPFHSVVLDKSVGESNATGLLLSVPDVHARSAKDNVKVHTVDTDGGIVLDAQIDVFLDAEAKVAILAEVLATQLVLTDLKAIHFNRGLF